MLSCFFSPTPAEAGQRVSIELVLAVDVSLSVNDIEYALQMRGIAAAFRDKDVLDLIAPAQARRRGHHDPVERHL